MISKELLSAVLDVPIGSFVNGIDTHQYMVEYQHLKGDEILDCCINIYHLAHKCKEWAVTIKTDKLTMYAINNYLSNAGSTVCDISCSYENELLDIDDTDYTKWFSAASEPEAIFAACEWILKETK